MTILNHTGAAALQRAKILAALIEAGVEGVPEADMVDLGGNWWRERLRELQRDHTIGMSLVEGEPYYFLTSGVERAGDNTAGEGSWPSPVAGSLSTREDALFDLPPESHYREAA